MATTKKQAGTKSSYAEMLRDPRWQRKRLEVMERADFKCERCDAEHITLNVHHRYYKAGCKPWDYPTDSLECLCENCHAEVTFLVRAIKDEISDVDADFLGRVLGFIAASKIYEGAPFLDTHIPADCHGFAEGVLEATRARFAWHLETGLSIWEGFRELLDCEHKPKDAVLFSVKNLCDIIRDRYGFELLKLAIRDLDDGRTGKAESLMHWVVSGYAPIAEDDEEQQMILLAMKTAQEIKNQMMTATNHETAVALLKRLMKLKRPE